MANNIYGAVLLTGGTDGCLDSVDGNLLVNGDCGIVVTATNSYTYKLNATSGATASSPNIIAPAVNPGTKRWILVPSLPSRLTKTANYTIIQGDGTIFANTTSGNITITLPAATVNEIYRIIKTVAANTLTIQRAGTNTIEGQTSISLTGQYLSAQLYSDGVATWYNV
jgi:hypothetical protein